MASFLERTRPAKRELSRIEASSKDEQMGVEVTVNHDGEITAIDISEKAHRNSLESIARSIIGQFNLARAKLAEKTLEAAQTAFPGSKSLNEAKSTTSHALRDMEIEQARANDWEYGKNVPHGKDRDPWHGRNPRQ